jgi:hypothetical protein
MCFCTWKWLGLKFLCGESPPVNSQWCGGILRGGVRQVPGTRPRHRALISENLSYHILFINVEFWWTCQNSHAMHTFLSLSLNKELMTCEVLMAVKMLMLVFWIVTLYVHHSFSARQPLLLAAHPPHLPRRNCAACDTFFFPSRFILSM